ncbi:MAG: hypothetical protein A2020_11245 [Lentisphaerae bacterium GWF2_45_14]|nr:MAG: hypothetical protein A2020_11245 [Lentisphaerae bacterium GWF2_45_14]
MNKDIEDLLKLLDDDNQQSASLVIAELLKREPEIDSILQGLQETENPKIRKRVHQIQSILTTRRRRRNLSRNLAIKNTELINGFVQLHMQWYDNDSEPAISKLWTDFIKSSEKYHTDNIERLARFMRKVGFTVASRDEMEPDHYCLGIVLEEFTGADPLICAVTRELAALRGLNLKIIQVMGDFALMAPDGKILIPKNGWKIAEASSIGEFMEWDNTMLLRMAASVLFLCAVNTDSFRYIHTIGSCLAKTARKNTLEFLPYPYNS